MRRRLGNRANKAAAASSAESSGANSGEEDNEEELQTKEQLAAAVSAALNTLDANNHNENNAKKSSVLDQKPKRKKPSVPVNHYSENNELPAATAFQSSAIALTQAVADIGMAAAEAEAEANGWDCTICISDTTGIPIQVKRNTTMMGTAASYDMAVGKAKIAAMFGKATGGSKAGGHGSSGETALVSLYPFLYMGGGVPIILNGSCCGAVGVSSGGLVTSADQEADEQVAWAAIKAMADIYWSYQVLADEP